MKDVDLALSQISSIRNQLAASTRFMGLAPGLNVLTAVLVFLVAAVQDVHPELLLRSSRNYIVVWAAVIIFITAIGVIEAVVRARRLHGQMASVMLNAALQKVLPFYVAAIVISWVVYSHAPSTVWLLPGIWQIFIGLLGFSSTANLPREMLWAAVWFFVCGALTLGFAAQTETLSPWLMGIPFGGGQLLVAAILKNANFEHRRDE